MQNENDTIRSGPEGCAAAPCSALDWHPASELPPNGRTCLCRGDSYDAFTHDGYLLAYVVEGKWVTGKQQNEVTVTEWALLPNEKTVPTEGGENKL